MHDHFLARSHEEEGFNLAVGEPFFLQEALKPLLDAIDPLPSMQYPALGGEKGLLDEIRHTTPCKHVVVANGAKQALAASCWALNKVHGAERFHHHEPYWLSYPTLLEKVLPYSFNKWPVYNCDANIITSPNNPDGHVPKSLAATIWDAAYAHPVYGFDLLDQPDHQISVWSAAKLFGASGQRIGWLLTDDDDIAKYAAQYVEITTSGVCTMAQQHVAGIMRELRRHPKQAEAMYRSARTHLLANADTFNELLASHCSDVLGVPATKTGMFAFFQPNDDLAFHKSTELAHVKLVPGLSFGNNWDGFYRMNLGYPRERFCQALEALVENLNGHTP